MALSLRHTNNFPPARLTDISTGDLAQITATFEGQQAFGNQGTVTRTTGWRIDRQKPTGDNKVNLQIQKNNEPSPSTIACVLVSRDYYRADPGPAPGPAREHYVANMAELTRVIRRGFVDSAATHRLSRNREHGEIEVLEVQGTYSNG